jgi:hypothetical protein
MKQTHQKSELTKEIFSKKIEKYVEEFNTAYIDAIIVICDEYKIEYDSVSKLLNKPILEHLREEGRELNLIPKILIKTKKLPF